MTYRPSDTYTICSDVMDWMDSVSTGQIKFVPALPLIAEFIPAYIPGHLIIVSGYTSAGKSQLISQIICDAGGTHKAPILVISVEDSRMEKMMSMISVISGIHKRNMLMGSILENQWEVVKNAMSVITEWPVRIHDDVYTLLEIEGLIIDFKPKIVVVDYVQNLRIDGQGIYERMSAAAQKLFEMGQTHGCTMIVASQVSNQAARENNEAIIDLKGAGELAAASHAVIQLRKGRNPENYSQVEINIKKNKAFGPCGTIQCCFNRHWTAIEKETEARQIHSEKLKHRGQKDE